MEIIHSCTVSWTALGLLWLEWQRRLPWKWCLSWDLTGIKTWVMWSLVVGAGMLDVGNVPTRPGRGKWTQPCPPQPRRRMLSTVEPRMAYCLVNILRYGHYSEVHPVKAMVFPVVMYGCESWTIKKAKCRRIDAFELWCWRRLLRVPWTARRSNQSILKESSHEYSLEGLMLNLKLQYFGLTH